MIAMMLAQLRRRPGRALALAAGIIVAATSFALLTSVVKTSRAETVGTVDANARSAYDVLIRPPRTRTALERDDQLVEGNFLSGIFGGITRKQWRAVQRLPQVDVAAPIANVGYVPVQTSLIVDVSRFLDASRSAQVLRLKPAVATGLARYPAADQYVYLTKRAPIEVVGNPGGGYFDLQREARRYWVCWYYNMDPHGLTGEDGSPQTTYDSTELASGEVGVTLKSPYTAATRAQLTCQGNPINKAVARIPVVYPSLLSAIDPDAEQQLVGLDQAVTSGRPLREDDRPYWHNDTGAVDGVEQQDLRVPILLADRAPAGGVVTARVERLDTGDDATLARRLGSPGARRLLDSARGVPVGRTSVPLASGFVPDRQALLAAQWSAGTYMTVGPVRYRRVPGGFQALQRGAQDPQTWWNADARDWTQAPEENTGPQLRKVTAWPSTDCRLRSTCVQIDPGRAETPLLKFIGRYDPNRIRGFARLGAVPLETYQSPAVRVGGRSLLPDRNLGGYVAQPPTLLTTLAGARAMARSRHLPSIEETAPISAIRVRVVGVHGVDPVSRARVNAAVAAIHRIVPSLDVDVTVGSSPSGQAILLPGGTKVVENWTRKGVALKILRAVDTKSAILFVLVLVVCGLFLAQAALASVRARRVEVGTLRTMGWSTREVFTVILGELLLVGFAAGLAGALIAYILGLTLDVSTTIAHAALVLPVALGLSLLAGIGPAWRATRVVPLDAIRPPVSPSGRARPIRGVLSMAIMNLRRMRGRTVLGAAGLALAVAAFTTLLGVTLAFHGEVTGSLLGDAVVAQVRAADYLSVSFSLLLGAAGAVDVLVLSQRERASDIALLRAGGWSSRELARLTFYEGLGLALLGGVTGSAIGVGVLAALGSDLLSGHVLQLLLAAAIGTALALLLMSAMLFIPIRALNRIAPAHLLAGE